MKLPTPRPALAVVLALVLPLPGCDWVQDRFRDCKTLVVEMVNRPPGGPPIHFAPENEPFGPDNIVGPGQSRSQHLCVETGDIKLFRVSLSGSATPLAVIKCGVTRARFEFEPGVARVIWDASQLFCEGW